ncbi:MAG TPA: glycosyltransferase [Bryobacteraceae bacterium]|nr:glycosyltransferase [Bryobacteraceae bacterium]
MLLARELGPGGSERQLTELAKGLDRSRWDPHVGCFRDSGFRGEELRAAGVPVAAFQVRSFRSPALFGAGRRFGSYIDRNGIRLVHSFDTPSTLFAVPLARWHGCHAVLSSQRCYRTLFGTWEHHALRATDRLVDAVVVNCRALVRHMSEDEGARPEKVRLCYNGIDSERWGSGPSVRDRELAGPGPIIGTVAVLRPEKGLPVLVEAFAHIRECSDARLVIVGEGDMLPVLRSLAQRLDVAGRVVFQPAVADVGCWLRAFDIFVLPSLSEALSNSLMEAMACGVCPIASDTGGNPELVIPGKTGVLVPPGDANALARALERLLADSCTRRQYAADAARYLRENFTLTAAVSRMASIYEEFTADRRTTSAQAISSSELR